MRVCELTFGSGLTSIQPRWLGSSEVDTDAVSLNSRGSASNALSVPASRLTCELPFSRVNGWNEPGSWADTAAMAGRGGRTGRADEPHSRDAGTKAS